MNLLHGAKGDIDISSLPRRGFYRPSLTAEEFKAAVDEVAADLKAAIDKHGKKAVVSWKEAYGDLAEERHELMLAIHANDEGACVGEIKNIATSAIWALASKRAGILSDTWE
jgi:hypothetical protein